MENEGSMGMLDELTTAECLELLASQAVGRLAVVTDGQPLIFPVNYALDGDSIVFRTDPGTKLTNASLDRVAFEVDSISPASREAWSVVITGTAREFTDAIDDVSIREQALPLVTWASGEKGHWVRIVAPSISGRRLRQVSASPEPGAGPNPSDQRI